MDIDQYNSSATICQETQHKRWKKSNNKKCRRDNFWPNDVKHSANRYELMSAINIYTVKRRGRNVPWMERCPTGVHHDLTQW